MANDPFTSRPHALGELALGLVHFRAEAIVMAGPLLLIATPVMRVAASIVVFLVEGDWVFARVTAFVLAMLIRTAPGVERAEHRIEPNPRLPDAQHAAFIQTQGSGLRHD